ncbi:MAG: hypothetical protein IKV12_05695 [Alistipes sp.]|nr:hypothetical protein [Alistipes sp.]
MARRVFRVVVAFVMLVLYTSVMAASDVVALTCHCNSHRGDVHTAFSHVHQCEMEHCHHHDEACHDDACHEDEAAQHISEQRCCNHDHSNEISLYIQPRTFDDDHSERQAILLAVVTDVLDFDEAQRADVGPKEYGERIICSLFEGYARSGVLRAPPALV